MNDIELSQIRVELTRLFEEQIEFFRKRSLGELAPVEHYKYGEKTRAHPAVVCRTKRNAKSCLGVPNHAAVNSGKNEKPPDGGDGQPGADEQSGRTCLSS